MEAVEKTEVCVTCLIPKLRKFYDFQEHEAKGSKGASIMTSRANFVTRVLKTYRLTFRDTTDKAIPHFTSRHLTSP